MKKNRLIIDLDNTITVDDKSQDYDKKPLNIEVKQSILESKKEFDITIFTARNMKTLKGDLNKIHEITKPIAIKWLKENKVEYDDIIFGKPYCGEDGHYVDDKNISIEEFIFKFSGPFKNTPIDIVVPFYNEEENILEVYKDLKKLERLFHVQKFIFVNNGSVDESNKLFEELLNLDKKIELVNIKENIGLGNGIKQGIKRSTAEFILLNHSDRQFDAYSYFLTHIEAILKINNPKSIFSIRKSRPFSHTFFTYLLRCTLSVLSFKKIRDFNGQPKLIERNLISDIDELPNNYTIDFIIYKLVEPNYFFPILEKPRYKGVSSWNKNILGKLNIFSTYLLASLK